jgi:hypothetical protein
LREGYGVYIGTNGSRFEGEWVAGRFTNGRIICASGEVLEGESNDSIFGIRKPLPEPLLSFPTLSKERKREWKERTEQLKRKIPKWEEN